MGSKKEYKKSSVIRLVFLRKFAKHRNDINRKSNGS